MHNRQALEALLPCRLLLSPILIIDQESTFTCLYPVAIQFDRGHSRFLSSLYLTGKILWHCGIAYSKMSPEVIRGMETSYDHYTITLRAWGPCRQAAVTMPECRAVDQRFRWPGLVRAEVRPCSEQKADSSGSFSSGLTPACPCNRS